MKSRKHLTRKAAFSKLQHFPYRGAPPFRAGGLRTFQERKTAKMKKSFYTRRSWVCGAFFVLLSACAAPPTAPPTASLALKSLDARIRFIADIPVPGIESFVVDSNDRFIVLKQDGGMEVIDPKKKERRPFPAMGAEAASLLKDPSGAAAAPGKIYVADAGNHRVMLFDSEGTRVDGFGIRGSGPKAFNQPLGMAFFEDRLYVADSGNRRIQIFGPNGEYIASVGPVLPVKDEKSKKILLEKPEPRDLKKEELEKIRRILQKKAADDEKAKTVTLVNPVQVAVDARGLIYIVDTGDDTVKVCDGSGAFIDTLPHVSKPYAVVAAKDGTYVADRETLVIRKYGYDLKLLYAFGSRGTGPGQFGAVDALAVDAGGRLLVADGKRGQIHEFLPDPEPSTRFWTKSPPPASVRWIKDLALNAVRLAWDEKGGLYAVDDQSGIYRIRDGETTRIPVSKAMAPVSVVPDPSGFLWVLDGAEKQAVKIDARGVIQTRAFELTDKSLKRLSDVRDIAVGRNGVISMVDAGNRWIWLQAFKSEGVVLSTVIRRDPSGGPLERPVALALDASDHLYVLDDKALRVHIYNPSGEPVGSFSLRGRSDSPVDLCVRHGEIYVTDADADRIRVFDTQGSFLRSIGIEGRGKGDFKNPAGIAVNEDLVLFVADTGNSRIQVLQQVLTPERPGEITVTPGPHRVELAWGESPVSFPVAYEVYRSDSLDTPFLRIGSSRESRFVDTQVAGGRNYFYRVSAMARSGNESLPTQVVAVRPEVYTPQAPTNFKALGMEWSVTLSWDSEDRSLVKEYVVYRQAGNQRFEIGRTGERTFKDQSLSPDTAYTYLVAAVSIDGREGPPGTITAKTRVATKDPIEIMAVEMQDIFSNAYKIYEEEGVGRIRVMNNSGDLISNLKISFMIKEFMDFPAQTVIRDLEPGKSRDVLLKAIFNNRILDVTEDTPVQTEVRASYFYNDLPREFTRTFALNIYEPHRVMWNIPERFAVFVTPKDPVIIDFVRAAVTPFGKIESTLQRAALVFHALGAMGVTYLPDPNNPYQITSEKIDYVDYLQFPRETLRRKSGDCDDLVALFSACLESMGINTQAVEIPGHMLMMFSTDIESGNNPDTLNGLLVIRQGKLWVPVETTLVGSSFMKAWEKGSASYYQWHKNGLETIDMRASWRQFKPASLPEMGWRASAVSRPTLKERVGSELATLKNIELKLKSKKYYNILASKPNDVYALMQIGIIYGKGGVPGEAIRAFNRVLEIDPENAAAINNKANALFLEEKYKEAARIYEEAALLEPNDPLIRVNQARCYQEMKDLAAAKKAFQKAFELDRSVAVRYRMMAIELLSGF